MLQVRKILWENTDEIRRLLLQNDNVNGVGVKSTPYGNKLYVLYCEIPTSEELKFASDLVGGMDNLICEVTEDDDFQNSFYYKELKKVLE